MTCKYNTPLEVNSNWFLKIHLGKQCCIIHRLEMGILEGISTKYIVNLNWNYSFALVRSGPKDWNYFFTSFHAGWLWLVLSWRLASTCWKSSFFKTVTLARNTVSTCLTKENRQFRRWTAIVSKTWFKSKLHVFPFWISLVFWKLHFMLRN